MAAARAAVATAGTTVTAARATIATARATVTAAGTAISTPAAITIFAGTALSSCQIGGKDAKNRPANPKMIGDSHAIYKYYAKKDGKYDVLRGFHVSLYFRSRFDEWRQICSLTANKAKFIRRSSGD